LLIAFCVVVVRALARGDEVECNCFGNIGSAPVGPATLVRNVSLAVVAGFVVLGPGAPGASIGAWLGQRSDVELVALGLGLALGGLAGTGFWFGRELLRQQGRLMLRIEALEGAGRPGLPMGVSAPSFSLEARSGGELSLDRLLTAGLPVLLVFSDAHCGPCEAAVPLVASAQQDWAGRLTIAVISTGVTPGSEAAWREQRLEYVGIASDFEVASSYGIPGSPAAVLVSPDGRIDSHTAQGLGQVTELLRAPAGHGVGADRDGDLGGTYELPLTLEAEAVENVHAP
jgi:peroxiredoxin